MKLMDGTDAGSTMAKVSAEGNLQTITPERTVSGTLGALNDTIAIDLNGSSSLSGIVTASNLIGTVDGEFTIDGSTWVNAPAIYDGLTGVFRYNIGAATAGDLFAASPVGLFTGFRLRVSAYTSGSASISIRASGEIGGSGSVYSPGNHVVLMGDDGTIAYTGGGVEANALRVTIASDSTGLLSVDDNGASLTVDNAAMEASLSVLDDWDESDRAKVNPIAGQAGVQGGAGASTALTQRVAIATDANAISGTVTANLAAGSNNIGDVDVLSVPSPLSTAGNGTAATAHRVTIASDSTGQVAVASLPALVAGSANIGDVDVLTVPSPLSTAGNGTAATAHRVTLASDSTGQVAIASIAAGDNNIGNVDVVSLPALVAGTANIGDVDVLTMPNVTLAAGTNTNEVVGDVAHDVAVAGNPILNAGVSQDMDDTAPPNRASAESRTTRFATDRDGALFAHPHGPQIWSYHENSSSALTDTSVHASPGAGLSLYVTDIVVSTGAATAFNIFFEEGASTVLGPYYLEAIAGRGLAIHFGTPKKITAATALTVTTSAAIAHSIDVTGFTGPG